jgi:hypothetical protein
MPLIKREFYREHHGPLGNMTDWWYLAVDTNEETVFVLHEWLHLRLGATMSDEGQQRIQLADFLARSTSPERRALFQLFRLTVETAPRSHL